MSAPTPVVHVVDDDESFRTAMVRLLRVAGYETRAYASAGDFLLKAPGPDAPGCLVLDVSMPGPSGLDLQEALSRSPLALPVIFLTAHADVPSSVRALKAGAADFLIKPVERKALFAAVQNAIERDARARSARNELATLRARFNSLSARERQVFDAVVAGRLNKQIAADLGAAERTIKAHRARVMDKIAASSVADLVHFADRLRAEQQ